MVKKKIFFALAASALFIGAGCTKTSPAPVPSPAAELPVSLEPTGSIPVAPAPELPEETHRVDIDSFAFAQKELRVKVGDTVVWTNHDGVGHTVTADDRSFDSPLVQKDGTHSITFTTPGTFSYFCKPHPFMKATVIVE